MTTCYPLLADRQSTEPEPYVIYIICLNSNCHYKMTVISVKIHNKVSETSPPLKFKAKTIFNLIQTKDKEYYSEEPERRYHMQNPIQYVVPFLPVILRPTSKLSIKILKRTQKRQLLADKRTHSQ